MVGFRPVARHRSREVLLYRQGPMNGVINAHAGAGPRGLAPIRDAADRRQRARASALWLGEEVLRRSVPLPGTLCLRRPPPTAGEPSTP